VIFGSHRFVHWRSRVARGHLGQGHKRLLVAVDHTDWGKGYRRSSANRIVARPHAANSRGNNSSIFVEIDFQLPCYLLSAFLSFHDCKLEVHERRASVGLIDAVKEDCKSPNNR
jgi:hypothetical protein